MTYGCHNRKPYLSTLVVQEGWTLSVEIADVYRKARMTHAPHKMSTDCRYTESENGQNDPKCERCSWKKSAQSASAVTM